MAVQRVGQGGAITLEATFRDGAGQLVDPVDPRIDILDSDGGQLFVNAVPTPVSLGRFTFTFTVPLESAVGVWTAHWTGAINNAPVAADDPFEVALAGDITVPDQSPDFVRIVEVDELRSYMSDIGLSASQWEAAEDVLDGLQRALERHLHRPLVPQERAETLWPDETGWVWPSATPILEVRSISGGVFSGTLSTGSRTRQGINVGAAYGPVVVEYLGGYDARKDPDVKLAILRAAAREMTVRHDDTVSVTDLAVRNVQPVDRRDPGWTDAELARFDRLRRRVIA